MIKKALCLVLLVSAVFSAPLLSAPEVKNKISILGAPENYPSGFVPHPVYAVGCPDWKLLEIVSEVPRRLEWGLNSNAVPKTTLGGFDEAIEMMKRFIEQCKKNRTEKQRQADPRLQAADGPGIYYIKNRPIVEQIMREVVHIKTVYNSAVASSHDKVGRFSEGRNAALARYKKVLLPYVNYLKLQMQPWGRHPGYHSGY